MTNIFSIDYFGKMRELVKEVFSFKKYKLLKKPIAVFSFIFMLPAFLGSLISIGSYYVSAYLVTIMRTPLDFMHNLETQEAAPLHGAGQFIVYFLTWPILFLFYAFIAFLNALLFINFTEVNIFSYLWTLCGFNYRSLITNETPFKAEKLTEKNLLALVFNCISGGLLFISILLIVVGAVMSSNPWAGYVLTMSGESFIGALLGFQIVYALIAFKEKKE